MWRFVLVVPAVLAIYGAGVAVLSLIDTTLAPGSTVFRWVVVVLGMLMEFSAVVVAAKVAPRFRVQVSVAALLLLSLLQGGQDLSLASAVQFQAVLLSFVAATAAGIAGVLLTIFAETGEG